MSWAFDETLRGLNHCECCKGTTIFTPAGVENVPGLSAIAYRVGTHPQFKQTMLARLSGEDALKQRPVLQNLKTRENGDFAIALIDAWATVADVLTFYQERIANESYLRTATERLSSKYLGRLIGYEPHPGVAASTYLAFTIDNDQDTVVVQEGTRVQSIPGDGQQPQTYETAKDITARPQFNEIKARLTRIQTVKESTDRIIFQGTASGLNPGDGLLIVPYLFSLDLSFKGELNKKVLSDSLREQFADNSVSLSQNIGITVEEADGSWLIDDKANNRIYALRREEGLLNVYDSRPLFRLVEKLEVQAQKNRTVVQLQQKPRAHIQKKLAVYLSPLVAFSAPLSKKLSTIAGNLLKQKVPMVIAANLKAMGVIQKFKPRHVFQNLKAAQPPPAGVIAFRTRAAVFGHNAPAWNSLPVSQRIGEPDPKEPYNTAKFKNGPYYNRKYTWADATLAAYDKYLNPSAESADIFLDNSYAKIATASWLVLKMGTDWKNYQVADVRDESHSDFTLSAKVTRVSLKSRDGFERFTIRNTTVYAESESLQLAHLPIDEPLCGNRIELDGWVDGLAAGQSIIICGELDRDRGNHSCQHAVIDQVEHIIDKNGFTRITLRGELNHDYVRDTVSIHANVVLATHGETKHDVLGSGDGSRPFQRFRLNHNPLTYVSAATPGGSDSTLEVRVNDLRWQEAANLSELKSDDRRYITRVDDQDKTTVIFGDGKQGARPPTGQENIKAAYRAGIGTIGNVAQDKITLLARRPLGVSGVTNPMPATGGDDPERRDQIRRNATLKIATLDRIVSLQDYEDFARAFAGIAKAMATWTWSGQERAVFVTVAGPNGAEVPAASPTYDNLLAAMQRSGDPNIALRVSTYAPAWFQLEAKIKLHEDYLPQKVLFAVEEKLQSHFSFDARDFGQAVTRSEVVAVIQRVPGVVAVDLDRLFRSGDTVTLNSILIAAVPQPGGKMTVSPAELLTLDPRPLVLNVMS